MSVEEFAMKCKRSVRAVQRWIERGDIPAAVVGSGKRATYLLRRRDVDRFTPPPRGRPVLRERSRKTPRSSGTARRLTTEAKAKKKAEADAHFAEQLYANLAAHFGDRRSIAQ
jgi:hypothetical protein